MKLNRLYDFICCFRDLCGTKLKANAAMTANVTAAQLERVWRAEPRKADSIRASRYGSMGT
jgi:hypothetical protein